MSGVHLVTFQICRAAEEGAGLAWKYRKPEQTVLVVANKPEEVAQVIAGNVTLEPGEIVEVTQQRQLEPGRKVFETKR